VVDEIMSEKDLREATFWPSRLRWNTAARRDHVRVQQE